MIGAALTRFSAVFYYSDFNLDNFLSKTLQQRNEPKTGDLNASGDSSNSDSSIGLSRL